MINVGTNPIFGLENIPSFKKGSGIHIKKKNRGKFTKSAKAAGESVQEHAAHVLSDPNATPLLKKRANFARNAAKWKHQLGGHIVKAGDNLWNISKKYTGDSKNYQKIAKANNISDPDKIFIGQKITIPSDLLPSKPGAPLPAMYNRPKQPKMKLYGFKQELFEPVLIKPALKQVTQKVEKKAPTKEPKKQIAFNLKSRKPNVTPEDKMSDTIKQFGDARRAEVVTQPVVYSNFILDTMKNIMGEEKAKDVYGVLLGGDHTLKERYQMLMNGIQSKYGIGGGDTSSQIKRKTPVKTQLEVRDTTVINPTLASETRYGDTIKVDKNFFMIPESVNLNNVRVGHRNRGSREPFNLKGSLIPTYKPIIPYERGKWLAKDSEGNINHYLGYDKSGKLKIGPLENFGPGDTMTQVYYDQLLNIPKDNKGNWLYGPGTKNPKNRKSPLVDLKHENGTNYRGGLFIMTGHRNNKVKAFNPDAMEMAGGGAYIVKADNEFRLIRGSVNNVMRELELIRNNHKNKPIYLYQVDNGSYNRGIRPYDNNYSSEELAAYDALNVDTEPGGHFFYIK